MRRLRYSFHAVELPGHTCVLVRDGFGRPSGQNHSKDQHSATIHGTFSTLALWNFRMRRRDLGTGKTNTFGSMRQWQRGNAWKGRGGVE